MADDMKVKFYDEIQKILSCKRSDNSSFLSAEEYQIQIETLKKVKDLLKEKGTKKSMTHYRMVRRFDILKINGTERLIQPMSNENSSVLQYVANEDLFHVIHEAHLAVGHGGRDRLRNELKRKYCNVTTQVIMIYLKFCQSCQKKAPVPKKGLVTNPILHSAFNSRAQIDLIDYQSQEYEGYRYIMVYQDHLTKFVILRALKRKHAEGIAAQLVEIYTTFGAPTILHSGIIYR